MGGANVLTAASLPWTGSTFRAQATGMPANSLVLMVRGLAPVAIGLPTILPQGQAGFDLFFVAAPGTLQTSIAIPDTVVLANQVLHQQIVPAELDALGNIAALTSTNALTLTIGTF
ncbi:MAG: hypothetical protein ABIP94_02575 [Planctomycetota bacterium]